MRGRRAVLCCVLVLVAACQGHPQAAPVALKWPVYSEKAASAQAETLAGLVTLAHATRLKRAPTGVLTAPPSRPQVLELLDTVTFWTVPGWAENVLSDVMAHPPTELRLEGTGGLAPALVSVELSPTTGYSPDEVLVSAVSTGGQTVVRVDVQAHWLPQRSSAENLPTSVTSATLDVTGPLAQPAQPAAAHVHRTLVGKPLAGIVADLDALLPEPHEGGGCLGSDGGQATITATTGGHQVVFVVEIAGCKDVNVTSDGRPQPILMTSVALARDVDIAVGVPPAP